MSHKLSKVLCGYKKFRWPGWGVERKGSMQKPGIKTRINSVEVLTMGEKQLGVQKTNFISAIILFGTISDPCPLLWRWWYQLILQLVLHLTFISFLQFSSEYLAKDYSAVLMIIIFILILIYFFLKCKTHVYLH